MAEQKYQLFLCRQLLKKRQKDINLEAFSLDEDVHNGKYYIELLSACD